MIYFLYLAWVLAVRRDTQGNQWNVQTCPTVCNERVRRTDAMMRCHRRYAIAMAHLFSVIGNKSGVWSSGREGLRSEETHRTPSYLPISTIFHSATMRQSEHKIPIFLSSVEVIPGGNLLKLCIIRQRFPALVCWKPKLHLDVSTTESEIQSLVEIGLSIFFLLHLRPIYQATAPYHGHEIHMRGIAAQSVHIVETQPKSVHIVETQLYL